MKSYQIVKDVIVIDRDLTELDKLLKKFLGVLKKYSDYLVVSGFVSISTGRARGTEDIDVLVPIINANKFVKLFDDLKKNGFWCYQTDSDKEAYGYLKNLNSIRFARVNEMFPNIEVVPFNKTKKSQYYEFNNPQKIRIDGFEFKIPPIEFEILYKELVLGSSKDIADARHLRDFFSAIIKKEKFKIYEKIIKGAKK